MMAIVSGTVSANVFGQGANGAAGNPAPPAAATIGTKVGLIDMGYILDKHPTMTLQMDAIDKQIKDAEDAINARKEALVKEYDSLKQLNESSPDYKKKEEEINKLESQLRLEFNRKDKEFAESKARVVYDAYKQVEETAKMWANANQIGVLVRYSRRDSEMDPKKPNTVQMGVLKSVVYFDPGLDLTDAVLGWIQKNAPQGQTGAPAQPRAAAAPNAQQNNNLRR